MTNDLNSRIRQRIEEKGLSLDSAAKQAGMERSYFSKLLDGSIGSPRADTLRKIAEGLDTSVEWLMGGDVPSQRQAPDFRPAPNVPITNPLDLPKDVEVRGTAAGSHLRGAFQISGTPIDFVRRPPGLAGARDVYALYVEGSSMEPQFSQGDLIFVHPHRPPRIGDAIVVQTPVNHDDEIEATIGIFRKLTEKHIIIAKHNPPAEVQILRNGRTAWHKIMTSNDLYGV